MVIKSWERAPEALNEFLRDIENGTTEINGYTIHYRSSCWSAAYTFLKAIDGKCTKEQLVNAFPNVTEEKIEMAIKDYFDWFNRLDDEYICKSNNYSSKH